MSGESTTLKSVSPYGKSGVACTLFEGAYHLGVGALVNSLVRNGYRGIFYAGYRGPLPPWAKGETELEVTPEVTIKFLKLETPLHFTYCKPMVMNLVFEESSADSVLYLDPDITVKSDWSFFENWAEDRVALCMDVNWLCHRTHPIRREWEKLLAPHGYVLQGVIDYYFNAGFVGVGRSQRHFIVKWDEIMDLLAPHTGNRTSIANTGITCFPKMDQDVLNAVVDILPENVSIMGPEAMDFMDGGSTMSHAVGSAKPWRKGMIKQALGGMAPSKADKAFLENAREPIEIFSTAEYSSRLLELRMAAAVGRLIRRR